jgi:hypothetical protein
MFRVSALGYSLINYIYPLSIPPNPRCFGGVRSHRLVPSFPSRLSSPLSPSVSRGLQGGFGFTVSVAVRLSREVYREVLVLQGRFACMSVSVCLYSYLREMPTSPSHVFSRLRLLRRESSAPHVFGASTSLPLPRSVTKIPVSNVSLASFPANRTALHSLTIFTH